jgi:hypothetical protein
MCFVGAVHLSVMDAQFAPLPPNTVKVYPLMALAACLNNLSGGFRVWLLLKYIDDKSGVLKFDVINAYLVSWGIPVRRWKRWMKDAQAHKLLTIKERTYQGNKEKIVLLRNTVKVAKQLGLKSVGNQPVSIPINLLLERDFAAIAWEGFLVGLGNRTISREALRKISGVPECSQRRYEAERNIHPRKNYVLLSNSLDHLSWIKEFQIPHAIPLRVGGQVWIAYQFVNTYLVSEREIKTLPRGRTKRINKELKANCEEVAAERTYVRVIHHTPKTLKSALNRVKKLSIQDVIFDRPQIMYEYVPGTTPDEPGLFREVVV